VSAASRPSTRASKCLVTQLVFVARGVSPRSTPCVCALRGLLPGWVFPDRTTRRHGPARLPHNGVGWAERVAKFAGAAEEEGNSTFLGVVAERQPASGGTSLVLLFLTHSAANDAPQRQVWLSPAGYMADGGGNGAPPGVEVPAVGGDGSFPHGGVSSVDDRHTSACTTDAGARWHRTLFQPLPSSLDPTGTRPPAGAPTVCTHPEAALSEAGTHFGVGKLPDDTTWGGGFLPPPAREPAGESSFRTRTAPGFTVSVPWPSGPVGDPLSVLGRRKRCQTRHGSLRVGAPVVLPEAHGVPGMARVSNGETPLPRSFGLKLPDR